MREPINLEMITTAAGREEVRAFAATFDHIVEDHLVLYAIKRGGKLIAYCQFIAQPIGLANWHTDPDVCSARDILEASAILRGWQQGNNVHGSVLLAIADTDDRMSEATVARLGFTYTGLRLYVSKGSS